MDVIASAGDSRVESIRSRDRPGDGMQAPYFIQSSSRATVHGSILEPSTYDQFMRATNVTTAQNVAKFRRTGEKKVGRNCLASLASCHSVKVHRAHARSSCSKSLDATECDVLGCICYSNTRGPMVMNCANDRRSKLWK